jgi:predicted nucleic acid binding AN1-type Zn finger protein
MNVNKIKQIESKQSINKTSLRCFVCRKKLTVMTFMVCVCSGCFCYQHMYPFEHNCLIDYKKQHSEAIQKNNPKITLDKFDKI